jgi:drug/metabolite transporter (DMT)-like permease
MITAFVAVTAALSALIILGEPLTVFTIAAIVLVTIGMFGAVSGSRTNIPAFAPAPAPATTGEKP